MEHMSAWRKLGIDVDQLHHWPGEGNVADIATKGKATLEDISEVSEWQLGPVEARFPRESWPAPRKFCRTLPEKEL